MTVLYLLIPLALVLGIAALVTFIWSLRHGQYDDLDTPPMRMLFDDTLPRASSAKTALKNPVSRPDFDQQSS
jgi:cbb3-type cytochrome oxidase maturation protein